MHRFIHEDGGLHCFRCGAFIANPRGDETETETTAADSDAMHAAAALLPCYGPDTAHPAYVNGIAPDGTLDIETCAAHPYADCEAAA